jgi:hypothetical protein
MGSQQNYMKIADCGGRPEVHLGALLKVSGTTNVLQASCITFSHKEIKSLVDLRGFKKPKTKFFKYLKELHSVQNLKI